MALILTAALSAAACTHVPAHVTAEFERDDDASRNHFLAGPDTPGTPVAASSQ